jgi:hypothetical protein
VEAAICEWLRMQDPSLQLDGIFKAVVPLWNKCVNVLKSEEVCGKTLTLRGSTFAAFHVVMASRVFCMV